LIVNLFESGHVLLLFIKIIPSMIILFIILQVCSIFLLVRISRDRVARLEPRAVCGPRRQRVRACTAGTGGSGTRPNLYLVSFGHGRWAAVSGPKERDPGADVGTWT
jgi:hypothetical protein